MTEIKPKWSRRKEARPTEIVEAAMDVFAAQGFAPTKLDDIAKRAGIAKGTLYRYFDSKEELFRAVVRHGVAANLEEVEGAAVAARGNLGDLVPVLLMLAADRLGDGRIPALARMVVGESRAFPDLAIIWHDAVAGRLLSVLTTLVAQAQARGEVRPGDPGIHAFSIVGPFAAALLFREVFGAGSPHAPDLAAMARQHAETVLRGLEILPAERQREG
ncbi:TetR/AcrR family transcriptional regulator [Lichenihabitans sp. Uapishka_5]|uniref:TetR/AcrR family transcriptional regulator n=1 Tax=Lichenihabitans sp. Uapishka_5 TaxID=3037302 RepID=UPI0029E7E7CF|nr:TetR/AcrR family transcriptional regulator [Lichenihabitans sp. Uapishka_5]MDX7953714.1 TetR/AcrR family transcriptional regulator [Lichenihabitans sp. Uapishka_5]